MSDVTLTVNGRTRTVDIDPSASFEAAFLPREFER